MTKSTVSRMRDFLARQGVSISKCGVYTKVHEQLRYATTQSGLKRSILKALVIVLPLSGLWFVANASYIHVKATLAQYLLEAAWSESVMGQKEVKPWPWADTWPVARLNVPGLGINRIVLAGANGSSLAFGPGRLFNPHPGEDYTHTMIAGHRDTHFEFLRHLRHGDVIDLQTNNGTKRFFVDKTLVVNKDDTTWLHNDGEKRLTLITCYPFEAIRPGTSLRYLVLARPQPPATHI